MKKYSAKLTAFFLAVVMIVSGIAPTALAAPSKESTQTTENEEIVLNDSTQSILEAAKEMAVLDDLSNEEEESSSAEKEAVEDAIFHNHEEETDLTEYKMTSKEMDEIVEEVLDENHMESTVDVTYETNLFGKVTSMSVEMDALVAMAGEEAVGLTQEQREELMAKYSQYMSFMQANADLFGVQTPYFTNKDNIFPIGSLLAIAGIPNQYLALGLDFVIQNIMSYEEVTGVIDLFHYANVFAVEFKKAEIESARDNALASVKDAKSDVQKHLQLTEWLAQWCTFDMPYIMEMQSPQADTESAMYKDRMNIYNAMYQNIKGQVYDGYYQYLVYMEGYPAETAAQVAEMMAKSYMDDPTQDGSPNGSESAMTLAVSIINLWEGSHVGALTYKTAVCLGYSNAYVYLVQHLYSNIYKNTDGTWKTYDQLNSGSNGNWNAIVDYVRITFDAEVTMFGVTQENFQSDHYWNAVKIDGKWYYVDPCYTDVYVEVMVRDRVETNGNMNHLYFLFSHDTAEALYEGNYSEIDTLYKGIATDKTYEDAWFAFARSPIYRDGNTCYYTYDSTDMIEMQNNYQINIDDIEYKIVSKTLGITNAGDANANFTRALVDFNKGQVYDPNKKQMVDNPLIKKYYEEFNSYKEDYPSLVISTAYYNNKVYFNLSNCIFSYDLSSGDVQRLTEYNTVTAQRDMTVAFGGMSFTKSDTEGNYGVTVKNPPIAGLTIRDGKMTVDIATSLGYISGKKSHIDSDNEPEDASNYGYMFEETHFNDEYLYASYSDAGSLVGDIENDNDEFMWSANIYDTIDMGHLTGKHGNYSNVTIQATCTHDSYTEMRCPTCGLIQESEMKTTTINLAVVDVDDKAVEGVTITDVFTVESTEEDYISSSFSATDIKTAAQTALGDEYTVLAVEMPETISWGETKTANVVVEAVQKETPVTVKVEGAEVVVESVTVTSAKKDLESAAKAAAESAVKEQITEEEYTIISVESSDLNWGSGVTVIITVEPETPVEPEEPVEPETPVEPAEPAVAAEPEAPAEPAVAALNIKLQGQSEQPAALTAEGESGKVHVFTADEIKAAVDEVLEDGKYVAVTTIISEHAVKYGEAETVVVTLKTSEATHQYVQFNETYYTKANGKWRTDTCYVCINCKDTVESKPENVITVNKNSMKKIWTWETNNYSTASVYTIPTELADIKLDCVWENPAIGSSRQVASSIKKELEGTCDEGVTYVYTATAGTDSDVKRVKQPVAPHQYIADEIQYAWAEDHSKCDISYKCSFCGKEGSSTCLKENMLVDYVEPTCIVDGKTIYTAVVQLEGNTYTNSQEVFNDNKAYGHEYAYDAEADDELCIRCKQVKPDSKVTVSSEIKIPYTGSTLASINAIKSVTTVEGSTGNTSRVYYTDKNCTKKVTTASGASKAGYAPSKIGVYYVKVTVKADNDFKSATSSACKLVIAPNQTTVSAYNTASGVYLYWDKIAEATGYRIYRREPGGAYARVFAATKNTVLNWTDTTIEPGINYEYDVRPYYQAPSTKIYAIVNADGKAVARSKLSVLNVKNGTSLSWDKVQNATGYNIWRKASGTDSYVKVGNVNASATSYNDTTVKNGTSYSYYVRPTGNVTTRTNKVTKVYLSTNSLKSVTSPSSGKIKVTWNKNAKAGGYRIRYSTSSSFSSYKSVTVSSASTLNKTISSLTKNKKYYVKIQSYKKSSGVTYYSAWSPTKSVTTKK